METGKVLKKTKLKVIGIIYQHYPQYLEEYQILSMDPGTMKYKLAMEYSAKTGSIVHHNKITYPGSCDHFTYKQLVEKQGSMILGVISEIRTSKV